MKNSTAKKSSQKTFNGKLGGLIFKSSVARLRDKGQLVFEDLQSWVSQDCPANAYIYHSVTTLLTLGISVSDAMLTSPNGAYVGTKTVSKPKDCTITLDTVSRLKELRLIRGTDKITHYDYLRGSRPTDKKMAYN